jgi:hypothetical protein
MVLIAAAVCSKTGKAVISRQFVEMTKSRIEGLLAAFPKLMTTGDLWQLQCQLSIETSEKGRGFRQ